MHFYAHGRMQSIIILVARHDDVCFQALQTTAALQNQGTQISPAYRNRVSVRALCFSLSVRGAGATGVRRERVRRARGAVLCLLIQSLVLYKED